LTVNSSAGWFRIPVCPATAAGPVVVTETVLIGIAVIAALLGSRALAADLEGTAPSSAAYSNWTGAYIGIGITARYNAVDANVTSASVGTPPTAIPLPSLSAGYTNPLMWWGAGPGAHQFIDNIAIGARIYGGWNLQVTSSG
jgi:opacity protein-like surface antigen